MPPSVLSKPVARQRINSLSNDAERRCNTLLLDLDLDAVDFNVTFRNADRQEIGEIDSLFLFENHLLIVEITNEAHVDTADIVAWFTKWSNLDNFSQIFERYRLSARSPHRLFIQLSRERPRRTSHNVKQVLEIRGNKMLYSDEIARYEDNFRAVGKWERNNFLNFLNISRSDSLSRIPAVLFYVSNKPAYTFSLSAEDLLNICYLSRRYKNEAGFQRAINQKRVDRIRKTIEGDTGVLTFPNSILINCNSILLADKPKRHECPKDVVIELPQDYSTCKVIDGQHRLLGFSKVDVERQRAYNLPVVAFEQLTPKEEIDTFVIINSEQKKVNPNLVLLLKADSEWPERSEFFMQKVAVDVVKKLEESSCLRNKIYMGYADQKSSDKWVTLYTLVRCILANKFVARRNALFQQNVRDIAAPYKAIRDLFQKMVDIRFPYFLGTQGQERFFLTNRGLRILFRFTHLFYRNVSAGNVSIGFDEALKILASVIDRNAKDNLKRYYGEGGARTAVQQLIVEFLEGRNEFRNFETDLRRL